MIGSNATGIGLNKGGITLKKNAFNNIAFYSFEKEGQFFERKSARIKPLEILRHLVAFANAEGGQLVIGIEDDGTITGFHSAGAHAIEEYRNIFLSDLNLQSKCNKK